MNKQSLLISSAFIVVASLPNLAAYAAPVDLDQSAGLLGSPVAQVPMQDPAVKKAIEWIQSKQLKHEQIQKKDPQSTLGDRPHNNVEHRLILGGPEVVPM